MKFNKTILVIGFGSIGKRHTNNILKITNSDVNDFLGSFQEEEEEEELLQTEELLQSSQNTEENQINNDYVPFATYNTLNET